jgi:FkbH-like protein
LAVCSKNDENIAKEPFVRHDEMVLRLEDIAVFVANWEDKAGNIRRIRETMNISMDSMVFVDDSPFERAAVRSLIPEITVPDLPEDPALYLTCLQNLNLFETTSFSAADTQRTALYQAAAKAAESLTRYATYDEYLRDLGMTAAARPFDELHYARIAQLTQRANQFNLRAIRYSEAEIAAAAHNGNLYTLYFTLQDKFTDYGLIGVVVMEKQRSDTLFVDTWLMSCRALGRGMEEFIVNTMLETAQRNGFAFVVGEYDKTAKNSRVENIYEKLGFSAAGQGKFIAATESFTLNKTFVNAAGCAEDATRNSA